MAARTQAAETADRARGWRRRGLLAAAGATVGMGMAPGMLRHGRASSGRLSIYSWSDYVNPAMLEAFRAATGIECDLAFLDSNETEITKLRAGGGGGFDIVMPTVAWTPVFVTWDLLQPLDDGRINLGGVTEKLLAASEKIGGVIDGQRWSLPYCWGTEGICYRKGEAALSQGQASYGDLWTKDANKGAVTCRLTGGLLTIGLYLERIGQLSEGSMVETYRTEEGFRSTYGPILEFAVAHKPWVRQFVSGAQSQVGAFMQNGCVAGVIWDGPAMRMFQETEGAIAYTIPVEGAPGFIDGMAIAKGAANVEQAYAWINWYYTPEAGALQANASGYSGVSKGFEAGLSPGFRAAIDQAYENGAAIDRLWWMRTVPDWYPDLRAEYTQKWKTA